MKLHTLLENLNTVLADTEVTGVTDDTRVLQKDMIFVCIRGAKYELHDAELTSDFPLGVSNEWAAPEAEISLREGTLLIVSSRIQ
jgi:thiamine pyrophosphokinase